MPPAAGAAAAAAISATAATAAAGAITAVAVAKIIAAAVVTGILTQAAQVFLRKKPKKVDSLGSPSTVRQSAAEQTGIYGEVRAGGVYVFMHTTRERIVLPGAGGKTDVQRNFHLHSALAVAGHEVDRLGELQLADQVVPLANRDHPTEFAYASSGRYAGPADKKERFLAVRLARGTAEQAADYQMTRIQTTYDPDFAGELWGADHRLAGIAYAYIRYGFDQDKYPTGATAPTLVVRGKKVFDPRTSQTLWSNNPALIARDFLLDAKFGFGASAASIDDSEIIAAANVCDEQVPVAARSAEVNADAGDDWLEANDGNTSFRLYSGMVVQISSSGSLPAPLLPATDYTVGRRGKTRWGLAASLADARARNWIDITTAGSGTHTLEAISELRYSCDFRFDAGMARGGVLKVIETSMAGRIAKPAGQWHVFAGAYRPPVLRTLDEDDLRGPLAVQRGQRRRDLFNAVKGTFVGPDKNWVEDDFPPVTNEFYEAQDNGKRRWRDVEFLATGSPSMAQRIAKIELERHRQQITVRARFSLVALQLTAGDTLNLSHARYGWVDKPFELVEWSFAVTEQDGGPAIVIDTVLRETAAAVFDWNSGEETAVDLAPDTLLDSALTVEIPGAPLVTEQLYESRDGGGLKVKALVSWEPAQDAFRKRYELDFKPSAEADYIPGPRVTTDLLSAEILDLEPGLYDFRLRTVNTLELPSDYVETLGLEIFGLPAPPATPTGVTISAVSQLAVIRWDRHPDLDVLIGGKLVFRHAPVFTGATWEQSVSIGDPFQGNETVAVLPLKAGSYLVKAIDAGGTPSLGFASVTTAGASILAVAQTGQLVEQPVFGGTHTNTVVVDGKLKLDGVGQFDAIADFDAVTDLDNFGGTFTSGSYGFSAVLDLRAGGPVRLESMIDVTVFNKTDLWDDRTDPIDQWEDVDGNQAGITGDAVVYVSATDDDPAGAPTWGPWERLDVADYPAQAFRFEARLSVTDPAYNIEIPTLEVTASEAA